MNSDDYEKALKWMMVAALVALGGAVALTFLYA